MKTKFAKNGEILGANNRENMWEQFPDTFGENTFFEFFKSRIGSLVRRMFFGKSDLFKKKNNSTVCFFMNNLVFS